MEINKTKAAQKKREEDFAIATHGNEDINATFEDNKKPDLLPQETIKDSQVPLQLLGFQNTPTSSTSVSENTIPTHSSSSNTGQMSNQNDLISTSFPYSLNPIKDSLGLNFLSPPNSSLISHSLSNFGEPSYSISPSAPLAEDYSSLGSHPSISNPTPIGPYPVSSNPTPFGPYSISPPFSSFHCENSSNPNIGGSSPKND